MPPNKLFQIPKKVVWKTFEQCKRTKVAGINRQAIRKLGSNRLHELWDQLSSGKYVPSPVRRVYRQKRSGSGLRALGVPTTRDHIVQTMLRNKLSSKLNPLFHPNSFLHKKGKKARREAIETARKRCLRYNWVLILDIKKYGDNIDHEILMSFLRKYIQNPWVLQYTYRMLKAPTQMKDGTLVKRKKGLPHDETLSYILGDFYLHDIFDQWMKKKHPNILFERWIDDMIIHCDSESKAKRLLSQLLKRFSRFKLVKNSKKTKIVYCKDGNRKGNYKNVSFNFLEYKFRSRTKKSKTGRRMAIFGPR